MSSQLLRLWPINRKSIWLMIITIVGSVVLHIAWHIDAAGDIGSLIWATWAFVWLPVILSYIFSAVCNTSEFKLLIRGRNFNLNSYQRFVSLVFAALLNILYTNNFADMETASWIFLAYLFLVLPIQLGMILILDLLFFLVRKFK